MPIRSITLKSAVSALAFAGAVWFVGPADLRAAEEELPLSACADVVGTFLTNNYYLNSDDTRADNRYLLSFTDDGHVLLAGSAEFGVPGYQPFSDGVGAWRCLPSDDGAATFAAIILDFTFPTQSDRAQRIARVDMRGTLDADGETLAGTYALSFVPLDGDPLDDGSLTNRVDFRFDGSKVKAP